MGWDPKFATKPRAVVDAGRDNFQQRALSGSTACIITGVVPSKSNCYKLGIRHGKAMMYKSPALVAYEQSFFIKCPLRNMNYGGYFELTMDVYYPSERADLDNALKIVLDCLQACKAIKNDRKCVQIITRKFKDEDKPRIELAITPVNNGR